MNYTVQNINKNYDYDVIVTGGGTAGVIAAVSAAREGLKTLLIESFGALGGTQTFSLVTPYMEHCIPGYDAVCSAIGDEVSTRMKELGFIEWKWFDPTMLKIVYEDMALESGVEILYYSTVVDTVKCDGKLQSVIVHNNDGFTAFFAKYFIDCTGDADIAISAGCSYTSGDDNGVNQSASLRFEMANVDLDKTTEYLKATGQKRWLEYPLLQICSLNDSYSADFRENLKKAVQKGELTEMDISHIQMFSVPGKKGAINFNCPETGAFKDIISTKSLTERAIYGKKAIKRISDFMKKYVPGFEEAYISQISPMVGIRESNRIDAEYQVLYTDLIQYKKFPDAILRSNYPMDVHGGTDKELPYNKDISDDEKYYEMPYRSLVPKGIDNLLVCGRCAGFDFLSESALRIQLSCYAMGEAAGIAVKLAIDKGGLKCKEVDGVEVRNKMAQRGAMLNK